MFDVLINTLLQLSEITAMECPQPFPTFLRDLSVGLDVES
jgi:hypothetical protein